VFDQLDSQSSVPLYSQIADRLKIAIVVRELPPGTLLESVRALAARLRINPATAARAYRQLETMGFVEIRQGHGCYVRPIEGNLSAREHHREAEQLVRALLKEAEVGGIHINALRAALHAIIGGVA